MKQIASVTVCVVFSAFATPLVLLAKGLMSAFDMNADNEYGEFTYWGAKH